MRLKPLKKVRYPAALLISVAFVAGCGGGRVSTFLIGADACVEWVFEAPVQLGHSMFGSGVAYGAVNAAAVSEDGEAVVVLTNYGGSWGWLEPCNAYLIDISSGRILRHLRGPYDTHGTWHLDDRTAYVRGTTGGRSKWFCVDFEAGKVMKAAEGPSGRRLGFDDGGFFGGGYYGMGPLLPLFPLSLFPRTGDPYSDRVAVGKGRVVVFGGRRIDLDCTDAVGRKRRYSIGCLAKIGRPHFLINDERRLLFATGAYMICVDTRGCKAADRTTGPPTSASQPAEPR